MLFDSRRFKVGKKAYLITPKISFTSHKVRLEFMAHLKGSDFISELSIFLTNEVGFAENRLGEVHPKQTWHLYKITFEVRPGDYQIIFRVTCGEPFKSDIAIDHMKVTELPDDNVDYLALPDEPYGMDI